MKHVFFRHAVPIALLSAIPFYFVLPEVNGSFSELFLLYLRVFLGIFFLCMLIAGMSEALRPGFNIGMNLVRCNDLNDNQSRNQIKRFIIFVAEIYIALLALFLIGFVDIILTGFVDIKCM
jgi:nucleoside recognition membrane protein YjiH